MPNANALRVTSSMLAAAIVWLGGPAPAAASATVDHAIKIRLDPATSRLAVTVETTLPEGAAPSEGFLLSAAVKVTAATPGVEPVPLGDTAPFFGNNGSSGTLDPAKVRRYRFVTTPAGGRITLSYEGVVNFGLSAQKEEYTRGFRETLGIVGREGIYLSGSTFWYPHLGPGLATFSLEAEVPSGWHLISQGKGTSRGADGMARWKSEAPVDEIYLVGGPLEIFRDGAGAVEALVYLHEADSGLASKYLAATAQYIEMYRALIGPYPYSKFALVENFWETGYGMPSFTLLGPSIVRFPFILTSSYPHEILHNWWGNGVFVDYATGNWSEGLTAYLADHLIQEQRGRGDEHRRATLQKYRDYVKAGRDFPLAEFRSRESAATEAVGYGKTLMGFHMLRRRLGDDKFRDFLRRFYREQRGKQASFADVRKTAEAVAGEGLATFFDEWVARAGAAALEVRDVVARPDAGGYLVEGAIVQVQDGQPFALDVPVTIQTSRATTVHAVGVRSARERFSLRVDAEPWLLVVDPQFDVFRRLDPRETPPSIGQIFGEPRILAVLPSGAPAATLAGYRELVKAWQSDSHRIDTALDTEIAELPADRAVWLLGRENRHAAGAFTGLSGLAIEADALAMSGERVAFADHVTVVTRRHPSNVEKAIGWIAVAPEAAFPGLARKLPHYGRYSYLGFEGSEPTNTVKGEWAATDSPLRVDVRPASRRASALPPLALPTRKALIELPPVFSSAALAGHVAYLAAPERQGRGAGSKGLDEAAAYIVEQFKKSGLEPGGPGGDWRQTFTLPSGPDGRPVTLSNIVGVLRGSKAEWSGQSALVTAHYDHLGTGWPNPREGEKGRTHAGADDNASGVAVMLELARALASGERPQRSLVFVAFSGEEAGLSGSRHFVANPTPFPLDKVIGVVNLDTVGRLGTGKLSILGAGTASEWPHIFRGASFVTGVDTVSVAGSYEASDQLSFIERGIPGVQLFTGPHADYHRSGDTADKVDIPGLLKVAMIAREAAAYLGERPQAMTVTIPRTDSGAAAGPGAAPAGAPSQPAAPPQGRRVTFGAVPDFAFAGPGVRLGGVTSGSPAEQAGLKEGDVLLKLDDRPVASLREFSELLRGMKAGQQVSVVYRRGDDERTAIVTLVER